MVPGGPNKFQSNPVCSLHKIFESLFFPASVNFKAFSDEYFVVKSHSRVLKFFSLGFIWILSNNSEVSSYLLGHILLF
jgi:hypothetical protein